MNHRLLLLTTLGLAAASVPAAAQGPCTLSTDLTILGHHDPFLAGQPNGTTTKGDTAPAQSPFEVPMLIEGGDVLRFLDVSGDVHFVGRGGPGPEGGGPGSSATALGISGYGMPFDAFLGVFLPDTVNTGTAPPTLDFNTSAARDFASFSPLLFQIFFIGDGLRLDGLTVQEFVAPAGATRLFLGSCDGFGWFNNGGSYAFTLERDHPCVTTYCTSGTTSNGCRASISASGTPSLAAGSGFTLSVSQMEGSKNGILFYGINGPRITPWGAGSSSFLCVRGPTQRMDLLSGSGTPGQCDGAMQLDWLSWIGAHPGKLGTPFAPGTGVWAQGWFRDPPSPRTTSLSDALEFVTLP